MRDSGVAKKIHQAVETLEQLVGQPVTVNRGEESYDFWPPYKIVKIDYGADRDFRCVVGRTYPDGSQHFIRRSVLQVTRERRFADAETIISAASAEGLWTPLDTESN